MINTEFVNNSVEFDTSDILPEFNSFMETCDKDINSMFTEFDLLHEKVTLESTIIGTIPENMQIMYEDGKKNIFTRVGEMLVKFFKELEKLIDKIIDKIQEFTFKKKTDMQKLEVLMKKHPELKDEAIGAFKTGILDLSDIKSLKELDDAFNEILKMSKKKDVDPKSLKARWEKATEKFQKEGTLVSAAKKTTAVIAASVAVATFIPNCTKAIKELKEYRAKENEKLAEAMSVVEQYKINGQDPTVLQLILQAKRYKDQKFSELVSEYSSVWTKMTNALAGLFNKTKVGEKVADKVKYNLDKVAEVAKEKKEAAEAAKAAASGKPSNPNP